MHIRMAVAIGPAGVFDLWPYRQETDKTYPNPYR